MFSHWMKRQHDHKLPVVHSFGGTGRTSGINVNYNNNNYTGIYGSDKVASIEQSGWINNTSLYGYDSCNNMILRSRTTGMQLPLGQQHIRNTLTANPILYGNSSDHVQNCYIAPLPSPGLNEVVSSVSSPRPDVFFSSPDTFGKCESKSGRKSFKPIAAKILLILAFCAILAYLYLIKDSFRSSGVALSSSDENKSGVKIIYSENDDEETVVEDMGA